MRIELLIAKNWFDPFLFLRKGRNSRQKIAVTISALNNVCWLYFPLK